MIEPETREEPDYWAATEPLPIERDQPNLTINNFSKNYTISNYYNFSTKFTTKNEMLNLIGNFFENECVEITHIRFTSKTPITRVQFNVASRDIANKDYDGTQGSVTEFDIFENEIPFPFFKCIYSKVYLIVFNGDYKDDIECEIFYRSQFPANKRCTIANNDSPEYYNMKENAVQVHIATHFNDYYDPYEPEILPYNGLEIKVADPNRVITINGYDGFSTSFSILSLPEITPGCYKYTSPIPFASFSILGNRNFKVRSILMNLLSLRNNQVQLALAH